MRKCKREVKKEKMSKFLMMFKILYLPQDFHKNLVSRLFFVMWVALLKHALDRRRRITLAYTNQHE